jgi:hypothetical protein
MPDTFFSFNSNFNSCWGNKIALTKDNNIRPCIYSIYINIIIDSIDNATAEDIIVKLKKYWYMVYY